MAARCLSAPPLALAGRGGQTLLRWVAGIDVPLAQRGMASPLSPGLEALSPVRPAGRQRIN
jgi:hypothetical protein